MLLRNISMLGEDPLGFGWLVAMVTLAIVVALTIHEFSHALAATALGDPTPRAYGRLTLNPLAHMDPWGTLLLFLVGFGWGKPVPVNASSLRGGQRGMAQVAFSGPFSGLVVAGLAALFYRATGGVGGEVVLLIILLSLLLSLFNLIPLPPLDGYQVALGLLPYRLRPPFRRLELYGPMPLMLLILMDMVLPVRLLWGLLRPGVNFFTGLYLGQGLL